MVDSQRKYCIEKSLISTTVQATGTIAQMNFHFSAMKHVVKKKIWLQKLIQNSKLYNLKKFLNARHVTTITFK